MNKVIYQAYPHFYYKMQQFVKENESIKNCDICFVGDSTIEMMDVNNFNNQFCVNRGISSDKSAGVLMTLQDRVIAIHPKKVFINIGTNDICDGYTISQIKANYIDIIEMLTENLKGVEIVITTIMPPCYYDGPHIDHAYMDCRDILRIEELNKVIKTFDSLYDNVKVADGYQALADENKSLRLEDTLDGVHLTLSGYEKLKKEISKYL